MKRGIIVPPIKSFATRLNNGGVKLTTVGSITNQEMAYFVLYWDKIISPANPIIGCPLPFEEILKATGILTTPVGGPNTFPALISLTGNPILDAFFEIIAKRKFDSNIDWTMLQIGEGIYIPEQIKKEVNTIKVQITDALPMPKEVKSIYDVLEFKYKRKDEFDLLHSCLDDMYLEILKSPDWNLSLKKGIDELRNSLININKVSIERFKYTTKCDFSVELNISGSSILPFLFGGLSIDKVSDSFPIGTFLGLLLGAIKISAKASSTILPFEKSKKYGYLFKARKAGII